MRTEDKQKLVNALMGGIPERETLPELMKMCVEEVDMIEHIVDDLLKQAEMRGRFESLLELAHKQAQRLESLRGL